MRKSSARFFSFTLVALIGFTVVNSQAVDAKTSTKTLRNKAGETPLIQAIVKEQYSLAHRLVKAKNADVGAIDQSGNDALLYAVTQSELSLIQALLEAKAPLDRRYDEDKENILFIAVRNGDASAIAVLVKARPELVRELNAKDQGVIEVAVEAAQFGTALDLSQKYGAVFPVSPERRATLQRELERRKKSVAAQDLLQRLRISK